MKYHTWTGSVFDRIPVGDIIPFHSRRYPHAYRQKSKRLFTAHADAADADDADTAYEIDKKRIRL